MFDAGCYDACLSFVRGDSTLDETLLGSIALRRLGRAADALALLEIAEEDVIGAGDDLDCGRFCLERGIALATLGDDAAGRSFGLARAFFLRADAPEAPARLAELALEEALAAWNDGDRPSALASLERSEMQPASETIVRSRQLRGAVAASDLDFRGQLEIEHATLREFAAQTRRDVWLEAATLRTLARVAVDLDERHAAKLVRQRAEALDWPIAAAPARFDVQRHLGWYEALRGDPADGRLQLARCRAVATSARERVLALVDAARVAVEFRTGHFEERLAEATDAAESAAWEGVSLVTLETLLQLAQLHAGTDRERSRDLVRRYRSLRRAGVTPPEEIAVAIARERYWLGRAAADRGERAEARRDLQHAFDFYAAVGFPARAALSAIALTAVGPAEDTRSYLREHRDRWPGTVLQGHVMRALDRPSRARSVRR